MSVSIPFSYRLERLVCQLDARSPILSDAEVDMGQELNRLTSQLQKMHNLLEEVQIAHQRARLSMIIGIVVLDN